MELTVQGRAAELYCAWVRPQPGGWDEALALGTIREQHVWKEGVSS